MSDELIILPAVDVSAGKAVRLQQGKAGTETSFGSALGAAKDFEARGAKWLHLVDLDRAFGTGSNAEILAEVVKNVGMDVELSGGIRDDRSLENALATGCKRINLGTAALENPEWSAQVIKEYGDLVAVGLDVRGETLAARGWTKPGGNLYEVLERLNEAGCTRYVVTDVNKDGMLSGPNIELLTKVASLTSAKIIASGGVSSLADIEALKALVPLGIEGAIVGKALYAGKFTLEQALEVAS